MSHAEVLRSIYRDTLKLSQEASDWLDGLWSVIQVFDDVIDKDNEITRQDANAALYAALLSMPASPFWLRNHAVLTPVMLVALSKWQASDARERAGIIDAVSFVWRASFYDVVLAVCHLVHGDKAVDMAATVASMYGENFEDYKKEFGHA